MQRPWSCHEQTGVLERVVHPEISASMGSLVQDPPILVALRQRRGSPDRDQDIEPVVDRLLRQFVQIWSRLANGSLMVDGARFVESRSDRWEDLRMTGHEHHRVAAAVLGKARSRISRPMSMTTSPGSRSTSSSYSTSPMRGSPGCSSTRLKLTRSQVARQG